MPITSGFNHVATLTPDLDRFVDYYAKVFGAEVTSVMEKTSEHPRMAILDMGGGSELNALEVPADEILGDRRSMCGRGAIDHYGIAVHSLDQLEQVRDRLAAAGSDMGEIQQLGNHWSLFFRDIDGMELEVLCPMAPDDAGVGATPA